MPSGPGTISVQIFGPRPRSLNSKKAWILPSSPRHVASVPARLPDISTERSTAEDGTSAGSGGAAGASGGSLRASQGTTMKSKSVRGTWPVRKRNVIGTSRPERPMIARPGCDRSGPDAPQAAEVVRLVEVAVGVVDHGGDLLPDEPDDDAELQDDRQRQREREVAEELLLEGGPAESEREGGVHGLRQQEGRTEEGQERVGAHEPFERAHGIVAGGLDGGQRGSVPALEGDHAVRGGQLEASDGKPLPHGARRKLAGQLPGQTRVDAPGRDPRPVAAGDTVRHRDVHAVEAVEVAAVGLDRILQGQPVLVFRGVEVNSPPLI